MKKIISNTWAVIIVLLVFMGSRPVWAGALEGKEGGGQGEIVTPEEESIISLAAARTLRLIAEARYALHQQDPERAIDALRKALTAMKGIKTSLPTAQAKEYIRVAILHLSYEKTEEVMKDLVPIEASMDSIKDRVRVDVAMEHIAKAKKNLEAGSKEEARKAFELANQALMDTETDLPLAHAEAQVISAYGYLVRNDSEAAEKALESAEKGVRYVGLSIYSPIIRSKWILQQSSAEYAAGRLEAARGGLKQAEAYLEEVVKNGDDGIRAEGEKLLKDIISVEDQLGRGGKGAASAIAALWEKAMALSERSAEYVSADWEELTAADKIKINLIEAKLHVAYAQVYQDTTGEVGKAKSEIDEAEAYLKKAGQQTDDRTKARLSALGRELKDAREDLEAKGPDVRARYEKIKAALSGLIRKM